ncbi:MAG TPA: cysteine desulfurase family protein, partial [Chitinophagales bacterium]|nr:cysteine desulfurase family protein [Chitinophagales bacterium]
KGNHIITTKIEHHAVLYTCQALEKEGFEVTYLDVDENGLILMDQLRDSVKDNTLLVVIMYVNNETGVIQPINEIGEFCKERDIAFFCDATQAIGKVKVDVEKDNIDVLCFSGHKINGPKGIGVLYKKEHMAITPLIHGGGQEKGMRGGTYNTPLIVGLGEACELSLKEFEKNTFNLIKRRTEIEEYYEANNIGSVNFKTVNRAPHIISITLKDYEADEYLMLKSREFVASTGSACNARIVEPSHVFREIKLKNIESIIRLSI